MIKRNPAEQQRRESLREQRPVVSIIALQESASGRQVLVQERTKAHDDTPYVGWIEVPQGKLPPGTNIESFAEFKLKHETGLSIRRWLVGAEKQSADTASVFQTEPLLCVVDLAQSHFAIAVVVLAEGMAQPSADAVRHQWLGCADLLALLDREKVFPLNRPMLNKVVTCRTALGLAD